MSKVEIKKVRFIDETLIDVLKSKIEAITFDREIDAYEKSVDVSVEVQDEVAIFVEGFITMPFVTNQVIAGDREATHEELDSPRWTEFNVYANCYGDICRFEISGQNGIIQDTDLEEELI